MGSRPDGHSGRWCVLLKPCWLLEDLPDLPAGTSFGRQHIHDGPPKMLEQAAVRLAAVERQQEADQEDRT